MFAACHASSCFGSFCGRPAFMGKSVFGKFSVFFSSTGSAMIGALVHPFHAVLVYRYTAGNIGKHRKHVCCFNEWEPVPPPRVLHPFPPLPNHVARVPPPPGLSVPSHQQPIPRTS